MSGRRGINAAGVPLVLLILLTLPWSVAAQTGPASSSSAAPTPTMPMHDVDHAGMTTMPKPAPSASSGKPFAHKANGKAAKEKPAAHAAMGGVHNMDHGALPDSDADAATDGTHDNPLQDMNHAAHDQGAMAGMSMDSMQGGRAPPNARSPDYSDGVGYGPMKADMAGDNAIGKLLIDQLEVFNGRDSHGQSWELGGWYGTDENKLWVRSEGERNAGKVQDGDIEAFWNHAIATYWGSQLGVRHDFGIGPGRTWAAFGVEGLAPYWFEVEATAYVGSSGRTAARLRVDYDVLFTQRLILTPELEFNLYGRNDPARGIGRGLSDIQLGLRLRYEIRRQFAPYIGVDWVRRVGNTADYARADGEHALDRQFVAGIRIWF